MDKEKSKAIPVLGVLLAAGASRRMQQPKQLLMWRGRPLLVHAIQELMAADCEKVVVVLGAHAERCQTACEHYASEIGTSHRQVFYGHHLQWESGQASSLHFGVQLASTIANGPHHLLIALGDQPLLTGEHYRLLVDAVRSQRLMIAATDYPEGAGVPACLHDLCRTQFRQAGGDVGAKAWLRQRTDAQTRLFGFGEATRDVDTAEEWLRLSAQA